MNKLLFDIQTVQSSAFRTLVEALKDILTDCNFIIDGTGIKLIATDNSHSVLIHMKLQAENFDIYECKEKITIGINMNNLYKLIKTMSNNDTLGLFMCEEDTNVLCIRLDNKDKNASTVYRLNLLDIDQENINIPPASFDTELTLPSGDFQKLIRDMMNIGENVEIKSVGSTMYFSCNGDFASQETILCETNNGLQFSQSANEDNPIQGIFSLKYLSLFTKCTNMCPLINMYIKNDYPLIIKYSVANLGDIKLCLAPNMNDNE
jgi:proliferating cell nuclear antigen